MSIKHKIFFSEFIKKVYNFIKKFYKRCNFILLILRLYFINFIKYIYYLFYYSFSMIFVGAILNKVKKNNEKKVY